MLPKMDGLMTSKAKNLIDLVIFTSACVFLVFCTVWSFADRQAYYDRHAIHKGVH